MGIVRNGIVKEMKGTNSNGKYVFYPITEQECIRNYISLAKNDIERMERRIKDLDFAYYLRTGKFPG